MNLTLNQVLEVLIDTIPEFRSVLNSGSEHNVFEFLKLLKYAPDLPIEERLNFFKTHCTKKDQGWETMNCSFGCDYYGPGPDGKKRCNHPEHWNIKQEKILKELQTPINEHFSDAFRYAMTKNKIDKDAKKIRLDKDPDCISCKRENCGVRGHVYNCTFYDEGGRDNPNYDPDSKSDNSQRNKAESTECASCNGTGYVKGHNSTEIKKCSFCNNTRLNSRVVSIQCPNCGSYEEYDESVYGHQKCKQCLITLYCREALD